LRYRSATRGQVVLLGAYVARVVLGVALTAVLGRALAPDAFGFFALVATIYLVAQSLLDLGSGMLAIREIARDPSRERPLVEGLMGWRQAVGVALAAVVFGFSLWESDPGRRAVLWGTAGSLLVMAPAAALPAFQARQAQGGPALVGMLGQAVVLAGAVAFHAFGASGPEYAWLLVLREVLTQAVIWLLAVWGLGYRPRPGLRGRGLRQLLGPALVFGGAVLAHDLCLYANVFLVRALGGEIQLGAYAAALRPLNPLLVLPPILMLPLLPVFSASALRSRDEYAAHVGGAASLLGGLGALGAAAGIGLAPDLVQLLYGGRYLAGELQAVTAFRWLCVALAAVFAAAPFTVALLADGRERVLLALASLGLATSVTGNVLFVPIRGFTAAAAVTAGTETVVGLGAVMGFLAAGSRPSPAISPMAPIGLAVLTGVLTAACPGSAPTRVAAGMIVTLSGAVLLLCLPGARRFRQELRRAAADAPVGQG
jgi:O-antigen/teichoic acid export membrane protein